MAKRRNAARIHTVKRGRSTNPVIAGWVADNIGVIVEDNGCDFDGADIGVFARSGLSDPISAICRVIQAETGLYLSGDSSAPEDDPAGWTMPDGRKFFGLSPVNRHSAPVMDSADYLAESEEN
jgi:hypothetical protein